MPLLLIIALALTGGISTSIAAEHAAPADLLYPVKVNVNESVRSAFAIGDKAQAGWEAEAMNRRLDEAEKLAANGKLNTETRAELESNFDLHSKHLKNEMSALKAKNDIAGAAEVNAKLTTLLKVHANEFAKLAVSQRGETDDLLEMETKVRGESDDALKLEMDSENHNIVKAENEDASSDDSGISAEANGSTTVSARSESDEKESEQKNKVNVNGDANINLGL